MGDSIRSFRRHSLAEQAAEILEQAILRGELPDPLPGEIQLSEKLKISRPTLRKAMTILARRGLVETAKGRRTRICSRLRNGQQRAAESSVCFIVSAPQGSATTLMTTMLDEMKFQLTAQGIRWDAIYESQLAGRRPEARLKEITSKRHRASYVLLSPSLPMQQWFEKSGYPVLVLGSCYEGIRLHSIDIDYRAVGWHAAGQFVKNGHKNILLIEPPWTPVGITATENALREYLNGVEESRLHVMKFRRGQDFITDLERVLSRKDAPTACLACRVEVALSVLGSVQRFGKTVPGDLSLISRDHHPILEVMTPELTRYAWNVQSIARKAMRLVYPLLQGVTPANRNTLVFPEFVPGQTLRKI